MGGNIHKNKKLGRSMQYLYGLWDRRLENNICLAVFFYFSLSTPALPLLLHVAGLEVLVQHALNENKDRMAECGVKDRKRESESSFRNMAEA